MKTDWFIAKIGDFATIGRGSSPRPITDQKYFVDGNIPWIKIADATASGKTIFKTKEYVNKYGASFSRYLKKGSLILSASGVSLGIPRFLGVDGCIHDGWLYLENFHDIDVSFLYYKLLTLQPYFLNLSYGAAIQNINTDIFEKTKIEIPPLPIQQKIASILSTYDNLIQNYKKQIEDLQTCASELYKEWFVRFRFPGYQTTQFENGIPVGWKVEKLFDIANIIYGYPFNSDEFCSDSSLRPVVRIRDILDNHTETYTSESCDEKYMINPNEMLIGMDGIFHMTLWTGEKAYQNQRTVRIISKKKKLSNYFLYFALYPQIKALEQMIVGTTVAHLGDKHLKKITVLLPDESLLKKSFERLEPIMNRIYSLQQQITNLTQQRDLLLPRLMSGKLEVK